MRLSTRRSRRGFGKHRLENTKAVLRLTSMMDIFTSLLLFLLKSFVVDGEAVTPVPGVDLPESRSQDAAQPALVVAVFDDAILVGDEMVASVGASRGAGTIAGGPSATAGAAVSRMPRGRLAYQPEYRVVTCPWSGIWTNTRARNSSGSAVSVPAVGPSDLSDRYVTAFAARSYVKRSSATEFRAQYLASRVANARSSSGTRRGPPTRRCARGIRSAAT